MKSFDTVRREMSYVDGKCEPDTFCARFASILYMSLNTRSHATTNEGETSQIRTFCRNMSFLIQLNFS